MEIVAVVAEVNSETDFVAKTETFQEFVQTVADTALASDLNGGANGEDIEALLATNGLNELLVEKTATIGEKLSVRRFSQKLQEISLLLTSMVAEESVLLLRQAVQLMMRQKRLLQI